jgi:mercuric ion transport protein
MLRTGIIGAIVTGICCFTPILSALGLTGASLVFIDNIVLTLFGLFLGIIAIALIQRRRRG